MKSRIFTLIMGAISSLLATVLWHSIPVVIRFFLNYPFKSFIVITLSIILILCGVTVIGVYKRS